MKFLAETTVMERVTLGLIVFATLAPLVQWS
jgi:hypothetical protein